MSIYANRKIQFNHNLLRDNNKHIYHKKNISLIENPSKNHKYQTIDQFNQP